MEALERLKALVGPIVRRGLSWWLGELAALVPARFAANPEDAPAILEVSTGHATLVLAGRGSAQRTRIPLDGTDPEEDRKRVQSAMRRRVGAAVIIRLDQSAVLESSVTLPLNAERTLRPILQNQLERLVPLPTDQVEFSYHITARSTTANTLGVKLIVATRASIDRALALVHSLGLNPRSVIAAAGGSDAPVTLWRATRDQAASPLQRWINGGLVAVAVLLCVTAYGSYIYRLDELQDELRQDIAQATKAAAAARDLVDQEAKAAGAIGILQRRQHEMEPLMVLNELTRLVPDNMWISQLSVVGRNVELIGYAPRVADLISRIETHDVVYDPKFRSPITMSQDGRGERFDVSFSIYVEDAP
jgi:general secretion pathway protein L